MEDELRHAKNDLVKNAQQIQKFMEEGTKTMDGYKERYEKAQETIGTLKDEIVVKENLLKNKNEVYQRVLDDLQDARKNIGILQQEKLELDNKNNSLQANLDRVKDEKTKLESSLLEIESTKNKIKKTEFINR